MSRHPDRDMRIQQLRSAGWTLERIGHEIGLTREGVRKILAITTAPRRYDWTGITFGRLTVVGRAVRPKYVVCRCICGTVTEAKHYSLRTGKTKSCGCLRADPQTRRAARMTMDPNVRRAIAKKGAIVRLKKEGLTQAEIAQCFGTTPPSISRMLRYRDDARPAHEVSPTRGRGENDDKQLRSDERGS
jgi:predicted transcriptional regulator